MADEEMQKMELRAGNKRLILACGFFMILLAASAALLPFVRPLWGTYIVGWLLLLAGLTELAASSAHPVRRIGVAWRIAGLVTSFAGLLFILNPLAKLVPLSYVVMAWLFVRSFILFSGAARVRARRKIWIMFSGAADLLLGLMLLVGLPIAALITGLFGGATIELVAGFALVFACSFLVTAAAFFGTADAQAFGLCSAPGRDGREEGADVA